MGKSEDFRLIDLSLRDCGLYTVLETADTLPKLVPKLNKDRIIVTVNDLEHCLNIIEPLLWDSYGKVITLKEDYPLEGLMAQGHYIAFSTAWEKAAILINKTKKYYHFKGVNKDVDIYCTQFYEGPPSNFK